MLRRFGTLYKEAQMLGNVFLIKTWYSNTLFDSPLIQSQPNKDCRTDLGDKSAIFVHQIISITTLSASHILWGA